jgi:hypothetical protein
MSGGAQNSPLGDAIMWEPSRGRGLAAWRPGGSEVGVREAVVVLQAHAEEPVQADVGEPDQGQ